MALSKIIFDYGSNSCEFGYAFRLLSPSDPLTHTLYISHNTCSSLQAKIRNTYMSNSNSPVQCVTNSPKPG